MSPYRALTRGLPLLALVAGEARGQTPAPVPPPTATVDQVDDYFGHTVADPYRWLEAGDSAPVRQWIAAENRVTFDYLGKLPAREPIRQRLTALWNYERVSLPRHRGGRYFYSRNDGLQNQAVLYVQPSLDASPRALLDPNTLSTDGTVALTVAEPSPDGRLLAYGTATAGSDWQEFRVREVGSGKDRSDHLQWIKFSGVSWTRDNRGFFYSRYPEPKGNELRAENRGQAVYYHRIGTPQSDDRLIYRRPDRPGWLFGAEVTDDGRYAVITISEGTDSRNRVYYQDLRQPLEPRLDAPVTPLLDAFDASYSFVGNDGPVFYFRTDAGAPRGRLVAVDLRKPEPAAWREVIPEGPDVLVGATLVRRVLVLDYLQDAHAVLRLASLDGGAATDVALPGIGALTGISAGRTDDGFFYGFTSFLYPTTIFRYTLASGTSAVFRRPAVPFDPTPFVTEQVFYSSRDGTRIPMFLTHRRDLHRDGTNPVYLTGYGGFDISILPAFSPSNLVWLELGGVLAVPNLRGGGEYGEAWHQAGMLGRKQNVFDDFIAAAEYLIAERYTSPGRLVIGGASNGGLLVGAAMTQRPDLFAVALPAVGVMDMLRYQKFTIGWAWVPEYGSADSAAQFAYLIRYSPLHNLKPGTDYPATLVTTADHDDRVVPAHSFKFAAALQAATTGRRPALIRIETRAGHGAGKPTSKLIEEQADRWAFAADQLGLAVPWR